MNLHKSVKIVVRSVAYFTCLIKRCFFILFLFYAGTVFADQPGIGGWIPGAGNGGYVVNGVVVKVDADPVAACLTNGPLFYPQFSPPVWIAVQVSPTQYNCVWIAPSGTHVGAFSEIYQYMCPMDTVLNMYGICTSTPNTDSSSIPDLTFDPKVGPSSTCHPISYAAGNKVLREFDYTGIGLASLTFSRTYNSTTIVSFDNLGSQWKNGLSRSIQIVGGTAFSYREGGKIYSFNPIATSWSSRADITDRLIELKDVGGNRTGWTYTTDVSGEVETYDVNGKLLSITDRAGVTWSLIYDANNRITTISDAVAHTLHFSYDASNRIASMTNPAGGVYTYAYSTDGNNNLNSVTYPDGKVKAYQYGEVAFVSASPAAGVRNANLLTGITDENGVRYATYNYDSKGRAFSEFFAGNVEQNTLVYNTGIVNGASNIPITTIVTDPRGSVRTYNFTTILGVVKSTGQSQPAGSGCAASAAALTYDANGNVASRTDFVGNKTTYVYDMARNLETSRTEGLTAAGTSTSATRTITTTWHPTWRLPLVVTERNNTGTALRIATNTYDAKGNITSITEADPVRSLSRSSTTTYTYSSAVPGLVLSKVVDGPRTDVNDITTYTYYPHDATCAPSTATPLIDPITNSSPDNLGCRGQLQSMTNALNQTTSFDRYNHHGQIEQMTDANGLVTTSTYDLRQRLLTRTVGTETTSLTYDGVGQVIQLTLPDSSSLSYTYDAARRLTDVQDALGNKVHYTLDSEGNHTNESTTDTNNQLTKTLSRSYDALNRLQQVTGVE